MTAALYEAQIRHVRIDPVRNAFRYRSYYWLVDVDDLPRLPRPLRALAGFDPRDHFDDPSRPIRANLDRLLAEHGIDLCGGRVLMLAHAKVFGYVFNPLSVFWCHDASGSLAAIVAEVHNTYGGRHSYVLPPSEDGVSRVDKRFYVSPFYDVSGSYRMRLPVPDDKLAVTIALHHDEEGARPFIATLRGTRRPATTGGLIRAALRHPWSTLVGAALIRLQGIRLYVKGLPVMPRHTAAGSRPATRSASEAARPARSRQIKETVS